jgi:nicotinamide-nucleotide amidase
VDSAEIIAVGTELLTPIRLDTNSLWLTGELADLGITVRAKHVVGDDRADLAAAVRQSLDRVDLVMTTGGLGPTHDDITREVVAEILERPLVEDAGVLEGIRERFARRRRPMPEINRRQAMVPVGGLVLANAHGTAPGLWLEANGRVIVLLPGPPRELQPMFSRHVRPKLADRSAPSRTSRRVVLVAGRAESQVAEAVEPLQARFRDRPDPVAMTILASPGRIELHLRATGADGSAREAALEAAAAAVVEVLGAAVVSTDGQSLEAVVGQRLADRGWTIAVAESCTGGLVTGLLTDVPGSSAWVRGGVVAYANTVKVDQLGVDAGTLAAEGAVSEAVARAMAEGVRARLEADVGLAITGIAGPGGGTPDKPVGTVAIALSGPREVARTFHFGGDRQMVRQFSTAAALDMVRRAIDPT